MDQRAPAAATRPKILVVDDTPANLVAMRRLLSKVDADVIEVASGNAALAACLDEQFAVILLDVNMPEMDGFEVASLLAGDETTRATPIIFVTAAYADDLNRLKGYNAGAVDYITKPVNDTVLLSKVRVFLELHRSRERAQVMLEQMYEQNRQLQEEIERRERAEAEARHLATHDALTGLANRVLFSDRLNGAVERSRRRESPFALLFIDIDGFKPVNDTHGHAVGDALLKAIALRLQEAVRKLDTVARLGGDEFAIVVEEPASAEDAMTTADRILKSLCRPFSLDGEGGAKVDVQVGASIGVAIYPDDAADVSALVHLADDAMYAGKRQGKNRCVRAG